MPGGDGMGPAGTGPATGRAAGYCAGYMVPGYMNSIPGRRFGFGFGRGGWRRRKWFYATGLTRWQRAPYAYTDWRGYCCGMPYTGAPLTYRVPYWPTKEQEIDDIQKDQAEYLEDTLSNINKHIQELEAKKQR